MRLIVSLPVLNQKESTLNTIDSLKRLQKNDNIYVVVDNGSTPPFKDWGKHLLSPSDKIIRYEENQGLPIAMNRVLEDFDADYTFFTHTDIQMYEQDWDEKTIQALETANKKKTVGVAGYFGALGLGCAGIYQTSYVQQQLARQRPLAGNRCKLAPNLHGHFRFNESWHRCAVLDGFSLIVKNDLKFWDGAIHHGYDNDICLESLDKGYQNIVINMDVDHFGGRTDVNEDWATPFGKTKQQIHTDSHPVFYEKWRPGKRNITLPYYV